MLTVLESINLSTDFLEKRGIESARTNAELLLSSILKCKRLDLYLSYNRPLSEEETSKYREFISRRAKYEPLQYIIGNVEFYGLNIKVNKSVLIPRPETEILVDEIVQYAHSYSSLNILDIGCGSGNITLALAKFITNSKLTGIDISKDALNISSLNAKTLELSEQVNFFQEDIFNLSSDIRKNKFDIIVSNPPYVSREEYHSLQKEIVGFEPSIAVTDEDNGYKFYQKIVKESEDLLASNGRLYFELGLGQAEKVQEMMIESGLKSIEIKKDYENIDRIIFGEKE